MQKCLAGREDVVMTGRVHTSGKNIGGQSQRYHADQERRKRLRDYRRVSSLVSFEAAMAPHTNQFTN